MAPFRFAAIALSCALVGACGSDGSSASDPDTNAGGKADDADGSERVWETILTAPFCDACSSADKTQLLEDSRVIARVIELLETAEDSVHIAQFTFSNRDIEAAVLAAHERGVDVRMAINAEQKNFDSVATRLADAGVNVEFVTGKDLGSRFGLQHAKFMRVDENTLLMGSNNWSSTGTSINNENTLVLTTGSGDPMITAFDCYFEAMVDGDLDNAASCGNDEVAFTPSSLPFKLLRDHLRAATTRVDIAMHHITFDNMQKEIAKVAERGVPVRLLLNVSERDALTGSRWDRIRDAGVEIRFKQANEDAFQIMHHKFVVIDGETLINGSGNWSGAFFNNYEFYVRLDAPEVVRPFLSNFERLWGWSLSAESLDNGVTAAEQDVANTQVFFGNLHAHHEAGGPLSKHDDGKLEREIDGELVDVSSEVVDGDTARHAFEFARDAGGLDFLALSPHVTDDRDDDASDIANISIDAYARMVDTARIVTDESDGAFVALPGSEWSTNSTGNHLGVLGVDEPPKEVRGDFAAMWDGYLPDRASFGEQPIVALNHPRTFRNNPEFLNGSWDQIFGVNLTEIPKASERRKKFNDFGLDDYAPLSDVLDSWIDGDALPDEAIVAETQANVAAAAAPYAKLMEVTISRGTEFKGTDSLNPSLSETEDGELERVIKAHSDWDYYLRSGWQLAPIASHDNHAANWGAGHSSRTAIIAPKLDQSSVLGALSDRAVYASEDEDLEIRLYADDRIRAGQAMGTLASSISLDLLLHDPDFDGPFEVTVFVGTVGGEVREQQELSVDADAWREIEVALPGAGEHFVYVEVFEAEADRMAWTAPVFVTQH